MGIKKRKKEAANKKEKLETSAQAGGALGAYRPYSQAAMNAAMQQMMSMMQGPQNMASAMYGGLAGNYEGSEYGNVVGPDMMTVGQTSMAPGFEGGNPGALGGPPSPGNNPFEALPPGGMGSV